MENNTVGAESIGTILDGVVSYLHQNPIQQSSVSLDGRVNSTIDEDLVISKIKEYLPDRLYTEVPPRFMCDIIIDGCPVNIKVSHFDGRDNVSSNLGLLYAVTGCRDNIKNFSKKYFQTLISPTADRTKDYYFLCVNKNDTSDVYWTSMKMLNKAYPNGSNLPFQCRWDENRVRVSRTPDEATEFLLGLFKESLRKRAFPLELFEECRKNSGTFSEK